MNTMRMTFTVVCFVFALTVAQAEPTVYTIQVDGLGCPFCTYGIEKQLSTINGVDSVVVDISNGLVNVTMQKDTLLDKKQAQQAVTDAGYTLRSFK